MITITVGGTDYQVPSSGTDTNWASLQVIFEQALAAQLASIVPYDPGTWTNLTLLNDWTQGFNVAQYRLDSAGVVYLRGNPVNVVDGTQSIAALPDGSRPPTLRVNFVVALGTTAVGSLGITPSDGLITPSFYPSGSDASAGVVLDGCFFSTVA